MHALIRSDGKIWSSGFLFIRSFGFGLMDQLDSMSNDGGQNLDCPRPNLKPEDNSSLHRTILVLFVVFLMHWSILPSVHF